jgi:hypothetical protein
MAMMLDKNIKNKPAKQSSEVFLPPRERFAAVNIWFMVFAQFPAAKHRCGKANKTFVNINITGAVLSGVIFK